MSKLSKSTTLASLAMGSLLLGGCATYNQSQPSSAIQSEVRAPMTADVKVGNDISGTSSATVIFGLFSVGGDSKYADGVTYSGGTSSFLGGPVESLKAAAAYKAVTSGKADVIIAPRYTIDTQDYFVYKDVTVTVTGKAGNIKSISQSN